MAQLAKKIRRGKAFLVNSGEREQNITRPQKSGGRDRTNNRDIEYSLGSQTFQPGKCPSSSSTIKSWKGEEIGSLVGKDRDPVQKRAEALGTILLSHLELRPKSSGDAKR